MIYSDEMPDLCDHASDRGSIRYPGHSVDAIETKADQRRALTVVASDRFCGDFRWYRSALSVSGDTCGLSARFWPPVSASKNSVPRGRVFDGQIRSAAGNFWGLGGQKRRFEPSP
jgi:hypothetical protein